MTPAYFGRPPNWVDPQRFECNCCYPDYQTSSPQMLRQRPSVSINYLSSRKKHSFFDSLFSFWKGQSRLSDKLSSNIDPARLKPEALRYRYAPAIDVLHLKEFCFLRIIAISNIFVPCYSYYPKVIAQESKCKAFC